MPKQDGHQLVQLDHGFTYVESFDHYQRDQDQSQVLVVQDDLIDHNGSQPSTSKITSSNSKKRGCFPKSATNKLKHWLFQNLTVHDCFINFMLALVQFCLFSLLCVCVHRDLSSLFADATIGTLIIFNFISFGNYN